MIFSMCCASQEYKEHVRHSEVQMKIRKCDSRISKYYHQLKKEFETLDSRLEFYTKVVSTIPRSTNIVSAQLWFTTFALAKELGQSAEMDRSEILYFRDKYYKLLSYAAGQLTSYDTKIGACLIRIGEKGDKHIRIMKEALTKNAQTDLTSTEISTNDDFFVEGTSWTELTHQQIPRLNLFRRSTFLNGRVSNLSNLLSHFETPDSLNERKQLEIFVKNVTKSGWMNYEVYFTFEQKMQLLRTLLVQILGTLGSTMKTCEHVKTKLNNGMKSMCKANLRCKDTLLPWLRQAKKLTKFSVKNPKFGPKEYEFLRFHIFSAEIHLKTIIARCNTLRSYLQDIISVTIICCDLMEKKYQLMLPKYDRLRTRLQFVAGDKSTITEDSAISTFYLDGYGGLLKQLPICFRISQFMLAKQIDLEERHSGADFRIRFF